MRWRPGHGPGRPACAAVAASERRRPGPTGHPSTGIHPELCGWARALVLAGWAALAATAGAAPAEIAASLTLDQAVTTALRDNAQVRLLRAQWEAMRERPAQARTLPNPMVQLAAMDAVDSGRWPNTDEKRFMVEQPVPWFGKLGLKGRVAAQTAEEMQRDLETMQREVVLVVKESYFDLYAVQQVRSITHAEEQLLQRLAQSAETMYATGQRSQQDVLKARAELTMLQQKLLELDQQESVLHARLNLLLNRPPDTAALLAVTAPLSGAAPAPAELASLAAAHRPEILKARAEIQRRHLERALMAKEFWPDFRLGVEYRNFRSSADMVMLIVGVELPIWQTKYRAGVREAEKMIEANEAGLEAVQHQASFDVQDAWFKWQTARRSLDLYRTALIPQAEARLAASESGYRTAKADFMDVLESERFLLEARVLAAMAEGQLGTQWARLERAVGQELPGVGEDKP